MKVSKTIFSVLIVLMVALTAKAALATVFVNEFVPIADSNDAHGEWIELFNDDVKNDVSLKGWTLSDNVQTYTFPDTAKIVKGGYLVLVEKSKAGDPANVIQFNKIKLNDNSDDKLVLANDKKAQVDSVSYGKAPKNKIPFPKKGESIARIHDGIKQGGKSLGFIISAETTKNAKNNRAPTSIKKTIKVTEGKEFDLSKSFDFVDADKADGGNDDLTEVEIVSVGSNGLQIKADKVVLKNFPVVVKAANLVKLKALVPVDKVKNGLEKAFDTFTFKVKDNYGAQSKTAYTVTVDVDRLNDKPTITKADDISVLENSAFTFTATATDVDTKTDKLSVSLTDSTYDGTSFQALGWTLDSKNKLTVKGKSNSKGKKEVSLVVVDDKGAKSDAKKFNLTVVPVFDLQESSVKVEVIGDTGASAITLDTKTNKYTIKQGDKVKVSYTYKNNNPSATLLDKILTYILGEVKVSASGGDPNDANYKDIVKYSATKKKLFSQESASDSFEFTVPKDFLKDFTMNMKIEGKTGLNSKYVDSQTLDFKVDKKLHSLYFVEKSVKLADENLTCSKYTDLNLKLTNNGGQENAPTIWVFDKPATLGADDKMTSAGNKLAEFKAAAVKSNQKNVAVKVALNASKLANNDKTQTLYVYMTSDYFVDANKKTFVGDSTTVELKKVGVCLKKTEIEKVLTIGKNKQNPTSLDLLEKFAVGDKKGEYKFINEDKDTGDNLVFEIKDVFDGIKKVVLKAQSNKELTDCQIKDNPNLKKSLLECSAPKSEGDGTNTLRMQVTDPNKKGLEADTIDVKVAPTFKFSTLTINGKDKATITKDGLTAKPLDTIDFKFKAKNFLGEDIIFTQVTLEGLDKNDFVHKPVVIHNLKSGSETAELTLTATVAANANEAKKDVVLTMTGKSLDKSTTYKEEFSFKVDVKQDSSKIILDAKLAKDSPTEVTCSNKVKLDITATNTGKVPETDGVILVKNSVGDVLYNSTKFHPAFIIPNGGKETVTAEVAVSGTPGTQTLSVHFDYNFLNKVAGSSATPKTVDVQKKKCFADKVTPTLPQTEPLVVLINKEVKFSVDVVDSKFDANNIKWIVQSPVKPGEKSNAKEEGTGKTFTFKKATADSYSVKASLGKNEEIKWAVKVVEKPVDLATFGITKTIADYKSVSDFELKKDGTTIKFSENVDISNVAKIGDAVKIEKKSDSERIISIDITKYPGLNKKAQITIDNFPQGKTTIYKYSGFGDDVSKLGSSSDCVVSGGCKTISHDGTTLIFDVDGFLTYQIVNEKAVDLEAPSEISFTSVTFGTAANTTFTIKNTGTVETMKNVKYDMSNIDSSYVAKLTDAPTSLAKSTSATVKMGITIPGDESSGKHTIGDVVISWEVIENGTTTTKSKTVPVYINPKSFLTIKSIKINGKTSGDLLIDDDNEIEVEIKNEYSQDMEDIEFEIKILDVDGDDLDESADMDDLDAGKSDDVKVDFDLSGETIDEDDYDIEITVEAEAKDGTKHSVTETKKGVDIDVDKHKVIISQASLTVPTLSCGQQYTALQIKVKNHGKSDEDEVEVHVRNGDLGINLKKTDIELDKFSKSDNTERVTFNMNLAKAKSGTYPLTVEVYRDGDKLEETKSVNLEVKACTTQTAQQTQQIATQKLIQDLQKQLQDKSTTSAKTTTKATKTSSSPVVKTTFRESTAYIVLLGILAILVFIALALGVAVMLVKKK